MKKMFKKVIKVSAIIIFLLFGEEGFAQKSKELIAIADGYVFFMEKDKNYGSKDKMLVKRRGRIHNAFLKFDISGHGGANINKAILKVYCVDVEDVRKQTEVEVFRVGNDWIENKLTY